MTYDPGRHAGGRAPVLRHEWREPLRAQRDPVADDYGRVRSNRDGRQRWRKQTWLGRFVSTYGWRAYALPVLTAITVIWAYQTLSGTGRVTTLLRKGRWRVPDRRSRRWARLSSAPRRKGSHSSM